VNLRKYSKHLHSALPVIVVLFNFIDLQWMLGHEPGLSDAVVRRFELLLLPGSLFFAAPIAILLNCGIAAFIGILYLRPLNQSPDYKVIAEVDFGAGTLRFRDLSGQAGNATAREGKYSQSSWAIEGQDLWTRWDSGDPRHKAHYTPPG